MKTFLLETDGSRRIIMLIPSFVLALSFIVGCASTGGRDFDMSAYDRIIIGQSTKADVLKLLGEPTSKSEGGGQSGSWSYAYVRAVAFAPTQVKGLTVVFDEKGTVSTKSRKE